MMSDKEKADVSKELAQAVKDPKLKHTETRQTASDIVLKLKCQKCTTTQNFPVHCDQQMEYVEQSNQLHCEVCNTNMAVPNHCNLPMKPFIVGK
jgi:primosomal protein N'